MVLWACSVSLFCDFSTLPQISFSVSWYPACRGSWDVCQGDPPGVTELTVEESGWEWEPLDTFRALSSLFHSRSEMDAVLRAGGHSGAVPWAL